MPRAAHLAARAGRRAPHSRAPAPRRRRALALHRGRRRRRAGHARPQAALATQDGRHPAQSQLRRAALASQRQDNGAGRRVAGPQSAARRSQRGRVGAARVAGDVDDADADSDDGRAHRPGRERRALLRLVVAALRPHGAGVPGGGVRLAAGGEASGKRGDERGERGPPVDARPERLLARHGRAVQHAAAVIGRHTTVAAGCARLAAALALGRSRLSRMSPSSVQQRYFFPKL